MDAILTGHGSTRASKLARWSELLLQEIFGDTLGDGRPVTTLLVDGALFKRTLSRGGIQLDEAAATRAFLASFPHRDDLLGWFNGAANPGAGLLAFLVLCCFAASEAAESEKNDYRERLREIMGWSDAITDCSGLPALWKRLRALIKAGRTGLELRGLELPDPGHRTQIGHAVELTFPSRPDVTKLRTYLERAANLDRESPRAVLSWLSPLVTYGSFSRSFRQTFGDFEQAWRSGERALSDHRFWAGWTMATLAHQPQSETFLLGVMRDEGNAFQLVDTVSGARLNLAAIAQDPFCPRRIGRLVREGRPILLVELGWARWGWAGTGPRAARHARAALFLERSISPRRLATFDRYPVEGAAGWIFTRSVEPLLSPEERPGPRDDDFLDVAVSGPPQVDGGRLSRPAFPITLTVSGLVETLHLSGEGSQHIELIRGESKTWLARVRHPLQASPRIHLIATGGRGRVDRILRLRSSALAPELHRPVSTRYQANELATPREWTPTWEVDDCLETTEPTPLADATTSPELSDIMEYLAARPGPHGLGSLLEMLRDVIPSGGPSAWDVLRALFEGGVLRPLRVQGWRGRAAVAVPPGLALSKVGMLWRLSTEGLVNEVQVERLQGAADRLALPLSRTVGCSSWAVPTWTIESDDHQALRELARGLDLPVTSIRPSLAGLVPFSALRPDADGANHTRRTEIPFQGGERLKAAGIRLFLCEREQGDAPNLWLVEACQERGRFWSDRHMALLDACRLVGVQALRSLGDEIRLEIPGAHPPLPVARWLRLATGRGSGPSESGYAYANSAVALRELRGVLGKLVAGGAVSTEAIPRLLRLTTTGVPGLARATRTGPRTDAIWRWARTRR